MVCGHLWRLHRTHEMMLPLNDPNSIEDDMGVILLDVQVSTTVKENKRNMVKMSIIYLCS